MAKQQGKKFTANVKVEAIVGVPLQAKTLEEAVAEARTIHSGDCIAAHGELVDSTHSLIGVSSDEWIY